MPQMPDSRFAPSHPTRVQAYRAVAGVTSTPEVLNPCGHEVPRFDRTPGFERVREAFGQPRYPRSRLCPVCQRVPDAQVVARVAGPLQLAADWGGLAGGVREEWASLLNAALEGLPDVPDAASWPDLAPPQRGVVAAAGELIARQFGLTFHEFLSSKERPTPTLTVAGYRRLIVSPQRKRGASRGVRSGCGKRHGNGNAAERRGQCVSSTTRPAAGERHRNGQA